MNNSTSLKVCFIKIELFLLILFVLSGEKNWDPDEIWTSKSLCHYFVKKWVNRSLVRIQLFRKYNTSLIFVSVSKFLSVVSQSSYCSGHWVFINPHQQRFSFFFTEREGPTICLQLRVTGLLTAVCSFLICVINHFSQKFSFTKMTFIFLFKQSLHLFAVISMENSFSFICSYNLPSFTEFYFQTAFGEF